MKTQLRHGAILCITTLMMWNPVWADKDKKDELPVDEVEGPLSVMVLGSGGPIATEAGRASASYLIFVNREPRILMDVGGGSFQR